MYSDDTVSYVSAIQEDSTMLLTTGKFLTLPLLRGFWGRDPKNGALLRISTPCNSLFSWSFLPGQKDHEDSETVPPAHQQNCTGDVSIRKKPTPFFCYCCTLLYLMAQSLCWNAKTWKISRTAKVLTAGLGWDNVKIRETTEWDVVEKHWQILTEEYISWKGVLVETVSDRIAKEN